MKKKHWTQTQRGKAIMRRNAKKRAKILKEKGDAQHGTKQGRDTTLKLAHIQGKVEAYIELHALSAGIPYADIAARLREVL